MEMAKEPDLLSPLIRSLFTLFVSLSLVLNVMLMVSVWGARRRRVPALYSLTAFMMCPDLLLFSRIILELMPHAIWTSSSLGCCIWQMCKHAQPIMHALLLMLILYQTLISLYMDPDGVFELGSRRHSPTAAIVGIGVAVLIALPSAIYSTTTTMTRNETSSMTKEWSEFELFGDHCGLDVWPLLPLDSYSSAVMRETSASYRLMWEILLPFLLPLILGLFPYVMVAVGLLGNVANVERTTANRPKMAAVAAMWLSSTFAMMHVASVINGLFDIFEVWQRLTRFVEGEPRHTRLYQTRLALMAYALSVSWTSIKAFVCFKCETRLSKALAITSSERNNRRSNH